MCTYNDAIDNPLIEIFAWKSWKRQGPLYSRRSILWCTPGAGVFLRYGGQYKCADQNESTFKLSYPFRWILSLRYPKGLKYINLRLLIGIWMGHYFSISRYQNWSLFCFNQQNICILLIAITLINMSNNVALKLKGTLWHNPARHHGSKYLAWSAHPYPGNCANDKKRSL